MLTLTTALLSALIGGLAALAVALLNNYFVHRFKQDDYKRKRREWFLEKQARDAEEIVATLERFLKVLAKDLEEFELRFHFLGGWPELLEGEIINESDQEILRQLDEKYEILLTNIYESRRLVDAWFAYDMSRLTVWLDNSERVSQELDGIGLQFVGIQKALMRSTALLSDIASLRSSNVQAAQKAAYEGRTFAKGGWSTLSKEITLLQRRLIADLLKG